MVNIPGASNFDRIFDGAKTLAPPCSSCPRAVYHVARCAVVILVSRYKVVVVVIVVVVVVFVCVVDKIIACCLFSSLQEKDSSFSREKIAFIF